MRLPPGFENNAFVQSPVDADTHRFFKEKMPGELQFLHALLFKKPVPVDMTEFRKGVYSEVTDTKRRDVLKEM